MLRFGVRSCVAAQRHGLLTTAMTASLSAVQLSEARRLRTTTTTSSTTTVTTEKTSAASASSSPSTPSTSAAAAASKTKASKPAWAAPSSTTIHKFSEDKAEASAYVGGADDVPSYSAASHMGYLLLHSRRMWLPLVLYAGYYALSAYLTPLQVGLYATASVVAQRLSVHGRANHVKKDLTGYTCVVTGGTSGIGLYTAMQLLDMGARVIIAAPAGKEKETMEFFLQNCRTSAGNATAESSSTSTVGSGDAASSSAAAAAAPPAPEPCEPLEKRVVFVSMDYMDQLDVKAAAARIKALVHDRVDLLVNCAGVWKEESGVTKQKFEEHIGVNFLGPFHFTEALLPSLRKAPHKSGRVVYVTCAAHNGVARGHVVQDRMTLLPGPDASQITARCYSASKLGNIYHAQSIASRRYEGIPLNRHSDLHPVDVCCADPGFCFTSLQQENNDPFLGKNVVARTLRSLWIKDAYEGSQTVVNCCVRDDIENGGYYAECTLMPSGLSKRAQDPRSRDEVIHWAMVKTIAKYYTLKPE
ncbi:putative mitochondrial short chain dehydrogenase/reductase [Leptomonas pyrrhocoris]|uniref:Putative mitochondrial short chain dehydrogenase/reductase n=1 Tax=Leptomonas pyrrhocoris TaxID=157538 RepID=A0A0M9FZF1_LEPPY|nr:putative mitochondrial short chain dehydrogenase/reductase [Leptomonas pyrrhocoris]KPA79280.1 putative mitochondrial short chain dehydrogenase/reductase [Leptomonas pyrrhocoris]|eukprot:XP_015657719.1 putative mitochondrial short chain dehydrogenase/reductase [Leptomonas pyrrhocoris]